MKIIFSLLISFLILPMTQLIAEEKFHPYFIEDDGSQHNYPEICYVAKRYYQDLFYSPHHDMDKRIEAPDIYYPQLEKGQALIDFYSQEKLLAYKLILLNYDEIRDAYLINPDEYPELQSYMRSNTSERTTTKFYPLPLNDRSYHLNLPFQYQNNWYVSSNSEISYPKGSQVTIFQILPDLQSKQVCQIQAAPEFDVTNQSKALPFVSSYQQTVENILASPGCGIVGIVRRDARKKLYDAVIRPWANLENYSDIDIRNDRKHFQNKHFSDWQYGEIWSNREFATYANLRSDAISELAHHYEQTFDYSPIDAQEKADNAIYQIQRGYYSLGAYYDGGKDFSFLQEILEARHQNWENLAENLQLTYGTIPLYALSLAIDHPQQLDNLPATIDPFSITSFYGKDLLMYAAHMNQYDTVKYFIDHQWSLDHVTQPSGFQDYDPLCTSYVKRNNRSALTYAVENASIELINLLISAGSDINIIDTEGNNLDFYLQKNPRFTESEKVLGLSALIERYRENTFPDVTCDYLTVSDTLKSMICNSKGLSIYERELNQSYEQLLDNTDDHFNDTLKNSREDWLQQRDTECSAFAQPYQISACIARTTRARTRYHRYLREALSTK